jgi:hypothetical protein
LLEGRGALQVGRTRHQEFAGLLKGAHDKAVLSGGPRAHAQRHVETFAHHVHAPVAHLQLHAHGRVLHHEVGQQRRERPLRQGDRRARLDVAARLGARELHRLKGSIRLRQHRARVPVDLLADLGDHETPCRAVHEAHVQL